MRKKPTKESYMYREGELEVQRGHMLFWWNNEPVRADVALLPHSCDEWVIGGPKEIRALMADLAAALKKLEA